MCCVINGSQSRQGGMASPLSALHMKASNSCKIQKYKSLDSYFKISVRLEMRYFVQDQGMREN